MLLHRLLSRKLTRISIIGAVTAILLMLTFYAIFGNSSITITIKCTDFKMGDMTRVREISDKLTKNNYNAICHTCIYTTDDSCPEWVQQGNINDVRAACTYHLTQDSIDRWIPPFWYAPLQPFYNFAVRLVDDTFLPASVVRRVTRYLQIIPGVAHVTPDCSGAKTDDVFDNYIDTINQYETSPEHSSPQADAYIFQVDIAWIPALSSHFAPIMECRDDNSFWSPLKKMLEMLKSPTREISKLIHYDDGDLCLPSAVINQHFHSVLDYGTVGDTLVSIPWYADIGLLFYRKDLLKEAPSPFDQVPKSWAALGDTAEYIVNNHKPGLQGFVWQGGAYEGLMCNLVEWIGKDGYGGVLKNGGKQGALHLNTDTVIAALEMAKGWISTSKISSKSVLDETPEAAQEASDVVKFANGEAVFMRNWPRAWAFLINQPCWYDKFGVALLPKGGTVGGWQLAIYKNSKRKRIALDLLRHLASPEEQRLRALKGGLLPSIPEVYKQITDGKQNCAEKSQCGEQMNAEKCFFETIRNELWCENGVSIEHIFDAKSIERPSKKIWRCYREFSGSLSTAAHELLKPDVETGKDFKQIAREKLEDVDKDLSYCRPAGNYEDD